MDTCHKFLHPSRLDSVQESEHVIAFGLAHAQTSAIFSYTIRDEKTHNFDGIHGLRIALSLENSTVRISNQMTKNIRSLLLAASLILGVLAFVGKAEAILFSGNTATSSPTTIDTFLSYTSASFSDVDVPVGLGPTNLTNLGTFTLLVCPTNNCVEPFGPQDGVTDFTLRITFTDPVVSGSPALFTADIFGTITRSGNSNNIKNDSLLTIDFVNTTQPFNYSNALGSGAFDISVNDPAPYTEASQFGNTRTVTGQITNLTFTPTATTPTPSVPEPASLVLFAIGLAGLPILRRKR